MMYLLMSYGQVMTCSAACESIGLFPKSTLSGSQALVGKPQSLNQTHPEGRGEKVRERWKERDGEYGGERGSTARFSAFQGKECVGRDTNQPGVTAQ